MSQTEQTRSCIIEKSIELLKACGLKFSLDLLCAELKISKKTVYRHFADKQALASAMFEKIYDGLSAEAHRLADAPRGFETVCAAVKILQSALKFSDGAIFNRYSLNRKISEYAADRTESIWGITVNAIRACGCAAADNPCFKRAAYAALRVLDERQSDDFARLVAGGDR